MRRRTSEAEEHQIGEIEYLLQYKRIRRMYLRLKPQETKVFVTAPYHTPLSEVEQFIFRNREWIRRQQQKQEQMVPKPVRHYVTGEQVYVWGKAYELLVLTDPEMVRQLCDASKREQCLDLWLKRQMEAFLPAIFQGCGSLVGKRESSWYVRKMKTRWGTCNIRTGRICINLNLGHLPPEYLSYIVTHELTHLWEKGHGEPFKARMDLYYPQWRERRQEIGKLAYML